MKTDLRNVISPTFELAMLAVIVFTVVSNVFCVEAGDFTPEIFNATTKKLVELHPAISTNASMSIKRNHPTATLLLNGKVLVVGGRDEEYKMLSKAELFDSLTGRWTTIKEMNTERDNHTATLLLNGKVLVVGGGLKIPPMGGFSSDFIKKSELYDPSTGNWTETGSLNISRGRHTATLLRNGKVLVVGTVAGYSEAVANTNGGADFQAILAKQTELYDPKTGEWQISGDLNFGRSCHTATSLKNGKILVSGGGGNTTQCEMYDPATEKWDLVNSLNEDRIYHTGTLLKNGKVLVAGGKVENGKTLSSAELFNPTTGEWTPTGSLKNARYNHTATLLLNGKVLVVGGCSRQETNILSSAELYDPATEKWTETGPLNTGRTHHAATLLLNGKVLVAGGSKEFEDALSTTELYDPVTGIWTASSL